MQDIFEIFQVFDSIMSNSLYNLKVGKIVGTSFQSLHVFQ